VRADGKQAPVAKTFRHQGEIPPGFGEMFGYLQAGDEVGTALETGCIGAEKRIPVPNRKAC